MKSSIVRCVLAVRVFLLLCQTSFTVDWFLSTPTLWHERPSREVLLTSTNCAAEVLSAQAIRVRCADETEVNYPHQIASDL